ncbi:MAG: DUF551 domain-containing protein [Bacteroides sp.]|nr:DUF551 domain-containing protein [Bacteroides sp.]
MKELEKAAASICGVHPDWSKLECFRIGFKEGAEWQAKQSPWISVDERLPEDGLIDPIAWNVTYKVIILTSNGKSSISQRKWNCNLNIWEWKGSGSFKDSVVKWMPIPE